MASAFYPIPYVIEKTGLAEFFLICWDLMQFAKSRGIPAQGRGSAAGSIVAYVLGIARVDPIRHELLFERGDLDAVRSVSVSRSLLQLLDAPFQLEDRFFEIQRGRSHVSFPVPGARVRRRAAHAVRGAPDRSRPP